MRDATQKYLEDVLCYADLAAGDERSMRQELADHVQTLADSHPTANPKEMYAMLSNKFGSPKRVGRAIAAARGRVRTYFKKLARKLPRQAAVAVVLAFAVRYAVAQAFYVSGAGVAPMIPPGSRVMVNKLAHTFAPGDIIVFQNSVDEYLLGKIDHQAANGDWMVTRNNEKEAREVRPDRVVGRVFLNTR